MGKIFVRSFCVLVWAMVLFALMGCADWIDTPATSGSNSVGSAPAIVTDAQHLLKRNGGFYLLNMSLREGKHTEKSKANGISSKELTVRWDKYHLFKDRGEEVVVFPIEGCPLTALSVLNVDGRSKKTQNKVTSKLIVRRGANNMLVAVIGTYLYDQNYARDYQEELDTIGYDFENSHFTGYFISSRLDGQMLLGYRLKRGEVIFAFRQNLHPETSDEDESIHLHIGLNSQARMSRSSFTEQESSSSEKCEGCHRNKDNCGCAQVIVCRKCKKRLSPGETCKCNVEKCGFCNNPTKECNCCKTCGKVRHNCICHDSNMGDSDNGNPPPNEGSNSGSTGNGYFDGPGDNHSGGGYSGGGSSGTPHNPSPFRVNNVYAFSSSSMISQGDKTASLMKSLHGSTMAVCNFGVQHHFQQMFPSHRPPGMKGRANDMVRAWRSSPRDWGRISGRDLKETLQKVKDGVNVGLYVVAGWENKIPNKSGHVVVVLPGSSKYSDRFNVDMPQIMDTGYQRRGIYYLDKGFGSGKIPDVEFYYYKN